jgi:hypothetical protein
MTPNKLFDVNIIPNMDINSSNYKDFPVDCKNNLRWNGYVSHAHNLFYVATPKVACTTFKWWFADLIKQTDAVYKASGSLESSPELVIHDLLWRVDPEVTNLTQEQINLVINHSEYFRFCLVRNPFSRIFSAWQSKWLLREPLQIEPYINYPFFNMSISNASEIALAFEAFIEHIYSSEFPNILDSHIKPQFYLLCPDRLHYSVISQLEDNQELCTSLSKHLGREYKNPFLFGKRNESLIPYHADLITKRAEELIIEMYARDFDAFNYTTLKPISQNHLDETSICVALSAVKMLRGRHQRISEMRFEYHTIIEELKFQLSALQSEINNYKQSLNKNDRQYQQIHEEMVRAKAQLDLIKDLWLLDDGSLESL